jgi:colanic acid/amylovoran biosynthesis protein
VKTFIITGGHTSNKGAQAMVFAVVQYIKDRNPDCDIWMFSHHTENNKELNFNNLTWDDRLVKRLIFGKFRYFIKPSTNYRNENIVIKKLKEADMIIDVSGFELASQFGFKSSLNYLLRIALAKKMSCKIVLLPQSFGPFNYNNIIQRVLLYGLMKYYLKYPVKIFAREEQGFNDLKRFTKNNLLRSLDIVLLTEKPKSHIVFKENSSFSLNTKIKEKGVAIIPNSKLLVWNKYNKLYEIYYDIIKYLNSRGYHVYILRHSFEDLQLCKDIYKIVDSNPKVSLLYDDYNCIDLYEIISQMDFVIASRYHSLIHAYKSGVPALVIGWAEKYKELMSVFGQQQYYFDVRERFEAPKVIKNIQLLIQSKEDLKNKIIQTNKRIKSGNNDLDDIFNRIKI